MLSKFRQEKSRFPVRYVGKSITANLPNIKKPFLKKRVISINMCVLFWDLSPIKQHLHPKSCTISSYSHKINL